jgi:hypothetical protein
VAFGRFVPLLVAIHNKEKKKKKADKKVAPPIASSVVPGKKA